MEKEFIPYEQALALKELGFDEDCVAAYKTNYCAGDLSWGGVNGFVPFYKEQVIKQNESKWVKVIQAPLYQQCFRWFREKYSLDVTFRKMDYGPESQFTGYYFSIYKGNELIDIHGADKKGKLYEDSELECLKKLIEISLKK
jgi:hypothetical protein